MHLMLHKLSAVLGVQLLELMVACGVDPEALKQKELDEAGDGGKQATDTNLAPAHTIKAVLRTEEGLKGVTGTFDLMNCTGTVEHSFNDNKIMLADEAVGCRVAVSSLKMGDRVYHIDEKNPEWKTGDSLRFVATDGSEDALDVRVDHQLSANPSLTEDVYFTISRSNATSSVDSKILLAAGVDGQVAPNFRIRKTEFIGLNENGGGQFVFHMDCQKAIKGSSGPTATCNGIPLSSLRYQLIKDDYDSSLSYDDAEAIFASNPGQTVDATADFEPFLPESKQYGGFVTGRDDKVLQGPDRIHDNTHMLLILQGPGPSYQYFNVDVVFTSH